MSEIRSSGNFTVSENDKELISSLLAKVDEARSHNERLVFIDYDELPEMLNADEISVIDRVYAIDPPTYGFKGPRLTVEPVPANLVKVEPQPFTRDGEQQYTELQFIPQDTYRAYGLMADAMRQQIGRTLLIDSSYRSAAYQAITFLWVLKINNFDVAMTAKRAAIPGYSEHGTPSSLALDFLNVDGFPTDETPLDFEGTQEYDWLLAHAHEFNFFMSYPKDNPYGVMFEPWHWRYTPPKTA